jgi:hypothetical protein
MKQHEIRSPSKAKLKDRCDAILRLFVNPLIREYLERERKDTLSFGEILYLLCSSNFRNRKGLFDWKDKWRRKWDDEFVLKIQNEIGLFFDYKEELYRTLEELRTEYRIIERPQRGQYRLRKDVVDHGLYNRMLWIFDKYRQNERAIIPIDNITYLGINANALDSSDQIDFYHYVHGPLKEALDKSNEAIMDIWIRLQMKKAIRIYERTMKRVDDEEKWLITGSMSDHVRGWLRQVTENATKYQKYVDVFDGRGLLQDDLIAKAQELRIAKERISSEKKRELEQIRQHQFLSQITFEAAFQWAKGEGIISQEEYEWLVSFDRAGQLCDSHGLSGSFHFDTPIVVFDRISKL